jgi:hypothetical protein
MQSARCFPAQICWLVVLTMPLHIPPLTASRANDGLKLLWPCMAVCYEVCDASFSSAPDVDFPSGSRSGC